MMNKTKLNSLLISTHMTLKQAMRRLNDTSTQILFVVDKNKILVGTVTDGDIRRGLIHGHKFGDGVGKIMHKEFTTISRDESDKRKKAKDIMQAKDIQRIPILDGKGRIIDMISWTDIFENKQPIENRRVFKNQVVIMAGGKGSRLEPFTTILPKPLIPIDGKPIIEIIMERFYRFGFERFIFTLNYKKEYIKVFLKENNFPYKIGWVEEDKYMGTAGSLCLLKDKINETFIVSNCDIILNTDYADIFRWHKENRNIMTLIGCHKEIEIPYGILEMDDGKLTRFIEKPNYDALINTGVYVLEPEVISLIPENRPLDMNILIKLASKKGKVSVYPIHSGWFDMGQWEEYKKSFHELSKV